MTESAYALPPDARVGRIALPDGGELAYEERGTGPAIVLLHSSAADRSMWRPAIARLADRYRCVAIDLRGYGESSLPRERFSWHDDTRAACAALALDHPVLVGNSLGGIVALDTAIGDGDHGTNMDRGMRKAIEKLESSEQADPGGESIQEAQQTLATA